jgi:type I restriction enzyme S subunit
MAERPDSVLLAAAVELVSDVVSPDHADPESLLVGIADLNGLGELTGSPRSVSDSRSRLGRLNRFARDDLLVSGTRSSEPKVWLADRAGYCTTSLTVLRPSGRLDPRYLLWWLRARGASEATRRLELGKEWIELPAKHRDVEFAVLVLDQLDTVIRLRRRALATAQLLAPAMYQERLGDPLDEDGVWPMVRLSDVIRKLETGWSPKCADRPAREHEWGVIKVSAVSTGRFRSEQNKALPQSIKPREELELEGGDLLMVRSNSSSLVGATAIVTDGRPGLLLTDKVWRLHIDPALDPHFLKALLSHPTVRQRLSRIATGSLTSMQNLTQAKVLDLRVALPPASIQSKHVDDLVALEDIEQAQLEQVAQLDELLDAVLGIVFSSTAPAALDEIVLERRALFDELAPLHQAIWKTLAGSERALSMPELNRRLRRPSTNIQPGVDHLRRALHLLTTVGVATQFEDSRSYRWSQAAPHDLDGSS